MNDNASLYRLAQADFVGQDVAPPRIQDDCPCNEGLMRHQVHSASK
jgi:hypothetical protein